MLILTNLTFAFAQEIKIRDVDESKFPQIKVILEFPAGKSINFSEIKILETNDTLVFSVDSLPDTENNKSICILISQEIMNNPDLFEKSSKILHDISGILSVDDRLNIIVSMHSKMYSNCFQPVSYEFSNDFSGIIDFFEKYRNSFIKSEYTTLNSCTVKNTLDFFANKNNIPSKKLLCILSVVDENKVDSILEIKRKAQEQGISTTWFKISKDKTLSGNPELPDIQTIVEIFDSIFIDKYSTTYMNKKLYSLGFYTKQNGELNQFEIEYKGIKQRSTFAKPDYMSFFKKNMLLIGIIAFFLLLIIFFIVNLIYTKRQMMQSVREIKMNQPKSAQTNDINIDNFNPNKTLYGTNTVTPFITVEIEGIKTNHELNKLVTRIGRSDGNDIIIDNLTISNIHASILIEGGQFFIQDNVSTNGTFVNDIKISKVQIKNGDTIRLGKARLILTC